MCRWRNHGVYVRVCDTCVGVSGEIFGVVTTVSAREGKISCVLQKESWNFVGETKAFSRTLGHTVTSASPPAMDHSMRRRIESNFHHWQVPL